MKQPGTLKARMSAAKPNRAHRLAGPALALGSLLLLSLGAQPAFAACGGVTTVGDEAELNAAIETFNADTTAESCVYTIQLDADIVLNESTTPIQNVISGKSLIIEGGGYQVDGQDGVNVQGSDGMQPLAVEAGTVVTMNDLTVTGGKPVGGGALKRGGGIRNDGTLRLNRCTVVGNESDTSGGGIANRGTLVIDSSTISGNTSGAGLGGGIYSEGGSVTITNSTVSGNDADGPGLNDRGGGIFSFGSLTLDSVTITDNGATEGSGIYVDTVDGNLTIGNTILSDNFPLATDCYFDASGGGTVLDQGYNLFVGSDGCGFEDGVNNNILSPAFLEPLADNGGPTQTHAPQLVSPAIDAGSTGLTVDQRGAARPFGAAADIGAYETQGCGDSPWSATNLGELNVAIECFNDKTDSGVYTISIDHGISATASTTPIDNANGGVELVIQGNGNSGDWNGNLSPGVRPFLIEAGTTVTINDFSITGGNVLGTERGGAIRNLGNLTINRCSIGGNQSEYDGGAIYNGDDALMVINDSAVFSNEAQGGSEPVAGGGIFNAGSLTIRNSTVSGNTSSNDGGGIASTGPLNLDSVTVTANSAQGAAGGGAGAGVFIGSTGTLIAQNTILAGSADEADCWAFSNTVTDGGHNLVGSQLGCGFTDGDNGTLVGEDPLLDILRNNGGPTRTHALLAGSPAIDAGDTDLNTDQRGYARPSGAADDIGAFEEAQVGTITVVKETPVPSTTNYFFTLEGGQLGEAIEFSVDTSLEDLDSDGPNDYTDRATFELEAGNYTVTEEVLPAQELGPVAIACEDNAGPIGNFTGATADIALDVYQDITCTFTNDTIYRISATVDGVGGSVSCSPEFVGKGDSSTCTAVPDAGYRVQQWTGACADAGSSTQCFLPKIVEDQTSTVVFESTGVGPDDDNDGVPNNGDQCADTPPGAVVDQNGCSIEQLCDCEEARNHGQYVSCVARTSIGFVRAGLIDGLERGGIMADAAQSQCGK